MNVDSLDLKQASRVFGVANTPLYLVRKLQTEPSVRALAEVHTGEEIVEVLRSIAESEPTTAEQAVRPYALLVVLWFKPEIEHLQAAAGIQTSIYGWYSYIANVLLATFSPVQHGRIIVPTQFANSSTVESTAPIERRIIIAS